MDKVDITVAVVERLVREQFPAWADLAVRPVDVDGNDNTSFRLGEELVVRLPSHERYVAGVAKERRWLPYLRPLVPLPIPEPVAHGGPSAGVFPREWSVYRWLDGDPAGAAPPVDRTRFATDVADFLAALRQVDASGGPEPGDQNFWRGGALTRYDRQTRTAVADLGDDVDAAGALAVWDGALAAPYDGRPVWVHGDVAANNLLVRGDRLVAVIDFGTAAVGDPACDTVLAWTFLDGASRAAFRDRLGVDAATWVRGRAWALWKAVITLAWDTVADPASVAACRRVVDAVVTEHRATTGSHDIP